MTTEQTAAPAAEDTSDARDPSSIGVLVKAFTVLEAMAEIGEPVPLREIAKATALPKGTLFRILQTLMSLSYVNQVEESGYYYMTSQISYLARNAKQEDLKMIALPLMTELYSRFNETVNLGILEGNYVYYVSVLEARRPLTWRVPTGARDTFYSTALGRAIAANLEPARRAALINATDLRSRTKSTVQDKAHLEAILDEVRESGVAVDLEENDDGVVCIGAPLYVNGKVVASISMSIPTTRYTPELGEEIHRAFDSLDMNVRAGRGQVQPAETEI